MAIVWHLGVELTFILIIIQCSADLDESLLFCKTSPPKLLNGWIKRDRLSHYRGQGYVGNMEFACLNGFDLVGNKILTCLNGTWSTLARCIPQKRCPSIHSYPPNTIPVLENLTLFQNDPGEVIVGSTVTLRCADSYKHESSSSGSLEIRCQSNGSWTSMPICTYVQVTCNYSQLYLPPRSRVTRMNFKFSEYNRQLHVIGSSLLYTCEEGYRLNDGKPSLLVECLSSGSWSTLPVCEFVYQTEPNIRCIYPPLVQNGFITLYNVTIWEDQTYTGSIVYECNYGFEASIDGDDRRMSECINGQWLNVPECREIPTCPKQDLLDIEARVEYSYVYNVSLQYIRDPLAFVYDSYVLRVCLPNYEHDPLSAPLKIKCQRSTNTWTGMPICRAIQTTTTTTTMLSATTDSLQTIAQFESSPDRTPFSTWIKDDKMLLSQENSTSSNNETSTNKDISIFPDSTEFTPRNETTTVVCYSNEIPDIPNAFVIYPESNQTVAVGTKLVFQCLPDYELSANESVSMTCSSDGTWSYDNTIECQQRSTTTEKVFFDISTQFDSIEPNGTNDSSTTINPDENLSIMNFSITPTTTLVRSNTSSFARRQIRQSSLFCKELPRIEHAQILNDQTIIHDAGPNQTFTGSLLFICEYGYTSDTNENIPFRISCQNGEFRPKQICIEKPRCELPPPIDLKTSSIISSQINVFDTSTNEAIPGSFILLACLEINNGISKLSSSTLNLTCLDNGQWSSVSPPCAGPFKRRCQTGITIPNARTDIHAKFTRDGYYDDGSRVSYRCMDNFIHDHQSGPLHITCRQGRWGPRPRCIPNGCLDPLPDSIDNGWKSAESYFIHANIRYYLLTRYSCNKNAIMRNSSYGIIDIECRNGQWPDDALPVCENSLDTN